MTSAILYKVSSAEECAVRGIFQNLPSAAREGSLLSRKALRVVYSGGPRAAWGAQPGTRKPAISLQSGWSRKDPFSPECTCAVFSIQGHDCLSVKL